MCKDSDVCYASNPLTPYGLIYLPNAPNETNAGGYTNTCVQHGLCKTVNGTTYNPGWRIAEGEVIVLTGKTPPESKYWSFTNYIYTRYHEKGWKPPSSVPLQDRLVGCKEATDGPDRCEVFSGINDPLNFLSVNLSQTAQDGNPFE
jgi:hypothetical protein